MYYQMIPLFVDCSGKRIVIFGGGEVASRKAAYFSREADVLVVSRSFSPKIAALPVKKRMLDMRTISDEDIAGIIRQAFLVIGTLPDPSLNNRIGEICKDQKILFNNAEGNAGDVIIPSVTGGENYTLAVSTKGSSPALSRFIREQIEMNYPALDKMVSLQRDLREQLKHTESSQSKRNAILREVLHDHGVWELLEKDPEAARVELERRYLHV
jgi:precorrin-2 dehydrogenase/sirohydrochlorin ferrochelatase